MPFNRNPKLGYTEKYNIQSGRVNFANYVQRRKLIEEGRLLGLNLYNPDNDASIVTNIAEAEANTTLEELQRYLGVVVEENIQPVATVPGQPTNLSATPGNQQVTISFTAGSNGGGTITNYEYSTDGGATFTAFSPPDASSPVTITGLTNGTPYSIALKAVNEKGAGPASSTISATPSTIPSSPTSLSATPGNQEATISFTIVSDGGATITNYEYSTDNGATYIALSPTDDSSPITITKLSSDGITNLTNGVTYIIRLKAVNVNGAGPASSSVSVTPVLITVPPAPTSLSGVSGNTAAYILFTQSGNGGSAITNYEYSTDNGVTFLAFSPEQIFSPVVITKLSSDGVTSLTNGVAYTILIKAVNSVGASVASSSVVVTPSATSLLSSGRLINLDASNPSSYPGSGTTWTNLDSGGLYSATLNGAPTYNTTDPSNKYFVFNPSGSSQFAQIAQATAINPVAGSPFTIQMWVRINNVGTNGGLFRKVFGAPSFDGYALDYRADTSLRLHENGVSRVYFWNSITGVLSSGWALYTANIQFGNAGGRTNKLFVNGRQVLTETSIEVSVPSPTAPLEFPIGFDAGNCDVGEFYYYNTELTVAQIIQNYDATKSRYGL